MARNGRMTPVVGETAKIVNIERERLIIEKERLDVETELLQVEKCRLDVKMRKCDILEQMLAVEKSKLESLCHQSPPHGFHATQRENDSGNMYTLLTKNIVTSVQFILNKAGKYNSPYSQICH